MPKFSEQRASLLSSQARIQVPWVKVTIGSYTFGIFTKSVRQEAKNDQGFYKAYNIQYPNYVKSLNIIKINGQVNQYTLTINYPVKVEDDPNFFEKVFSSVNSTRKIVFTYGDASMPSYVYKDEEAIITSIHQSFNFGGSGSTSPVITYNIKAVSGASLKTSASMSFPGKRAKPSDEIKKLFKNKQSGLQGVFTGMNLKNLDSLVAGDDQVVQLEAKLNISALDYINYLASCMIPVGQTRSNISSDIYILTIYDDTTYDKLYNDYSNRVTTGPYFKVTRTSYISQQSDAYEVDIGFNTSTIVTDFQINNNENYSLYYDYQGKLNPEEYVRRITSDGTWEDIYAPTLTSNNPKFETRPNDITWWTKITKYPISASITIQGLIRPATLMTYLRLNTIFPGGHKHISSGLYIVTKQTDNIDDSGYRTTLELTKIAGDNYIKTNQNR